LIALSRRPENSFDLELVADDEDLRVEVCLEREAAFAGDAFEVAHGAANDLRNVERLEVEESSPA
jgi:hypothetical protein